jgi:hypothetical protein
MKRIHKILAGTVGALTLAVVTAVTAAPDGPLAGTGRYCDTGPGMGGIGGMGMMHGGMWGGGPGVMSGQYLTQMKTRLAITPQQEPAWQAFAAKATEQASLMQATHAQHHQAVDTNAAAPDVMAQHIGQMTQHMAGLQAVNAALKDLYAVLTPEQRSVADQVFVHTGPRGFGRGMHG